MFIRRLRRLRQSGAIRNLVLETRLHPSAFILPIFLQESGAKPRPTYPGFHRYLPHDLPAIIDRALSLGISTFSIFPIIPLASKSHSGALSCDPENFLHRTVRWIKSRYPEICIMTDVALDPYTLHGHDGLLDLHTGEVLNDETVAVLVEMALQQAAAGSDMVAPSDMMDGRIHAIRSALDRSGFQKTLVHAYAVKFASCLYQPFRDCVGSSLLCGDKLSYQIAPANRKQALLEAREDVREGADMIMVKPASLYLDIIYQLSLEIEVPLSAYQVSGEYAMICSAANEGLVDRDAALLESALAARRAGAAMLLSYGALEMALAWGLEAGTIQSRAPAALALCSQCP